MTAFDREPRDVQEKQGFTDSRYNIMLGSNVPNRDLKYKT